jgi:hypothetical protein
VYPATSVDILAEKNTYCYCEPNPTSLGLSKSCYGSTLLPKKQAHHVDSLISVVKMSQRKYVIGFLTVYVVYGVQS